MTTPTLLIVAKAPVPGLAKTRIAASIGDAAAAELAAAALLETLVTAASVGWPVVVALTGEVADAARADQIVEALVRTRVIEQRGDGLGERLAFAHADADAGHGVVQVGMDTPQLTVDDFLVAGRAVSAGKKAIGPAVDGGWWVLGLPDPASAACLAEVPMSCDDTCAQTEAAMGGGFERLRELRDMDTFGDAVSIAHEIPDSRLARVVKELEARV